MIRRPRMLALGALVCTVLAVAAVPAFAGDGPTVEPVATGLDNPRGLSVGAGGLLVAEAGGVPDPGDCITDPEFGTVCFSDTGAVSSVALPGGAVTELFGGLPSLAGEDGTFAGGPHAAVDDGSDIWAVVGGGPQELDERFGTLLRDGSIAADLAAHEATENPDSVNRYGIQPGQVTRDCKLTLKEQQEAGIPWFKGPVDSNPYGLTVVDGGVVATDAGGNDLLRFAGGSLGTLSVLPPILQSLPEAEDIPPCAVGKLYRSDPVPTAVVRGPDGALYAATLPGFPEGPGAAKVFRIDPKTGHASVFADGFTSAVGLAFLGDALYVTELFTGTIKRVHVHTGPGGRLEAGAMSDAVTDLSFPHGIAALDGALYVTVGSVCPAGGVAPFCPPGAIVKITGV